MVEFILQWLKFSYKFIIICISLSKDIKLWDLRAMELARLLGM